MSFRRIGVLVLPVAAIVVLHLLVSSYVGRLPTGSQESKYKREELLAKLDRLESDMEALKASRSKQQAMASATTTTNANTLSQLESQLLQLQETKERLELRLNSWMNYNSDPYLGVKADPFLCRNSTHLVEYGCQQADKCPGLYDHPICLDVLQPRDCIVYDFGIRANPEFGYVLVRPPFYCQVYAFDPSPIAQQWYKGEAGSNKDKAEYLRNHPNYTFFSFGAGGINGNVRLNEYDWGQVSIIRFPMKVRKDCSDVPTGNCKIDNTVHTGQQFSLPVRTLKSIMDELGHSKIDVLKVDVEGSEYMFMEKAIEDGVMDKVQQLTVEWHHHDFDSRYGGGSSPPINMLVALLKKIGLEQFFIRSEIGGWPTVEREYWEKRLDLRYNLASFVKTKLLD